MNDSCRIIDDILKKKVFLLRETVEYYPGDDSVVSLFYTRDDLCIIIDINLCESRDPIFDYEFYTQRQNEYMAQYRQCLRLYFDDRFVTSLNELLDEKKLIDFSKESYIQRDQTYIDNSALESEFEDRFVDVYGPEALEFLFKEFGFLDFDGKQTYLDFALNTVNGYIAIEENGVAYHHPQLIGYEKYLKQLEKQNAFCYFGYKLFRFSSLDCKNREKTNDNIRHFFGDKEQFIKKEYVMAQREVELYDHQKVTLAKIAEDRKNGKYTYLISVPTAAGKSRIVEEDISNLLVSNPNLKILIVAPTTTIVDDWVNRIHKVLADLKMNIVVSSSIHHQITCSTYHALWSNTNVVDPSYFDYIVIDEAHHAAAPMIRRALRYFTPKYLVGLTATPDRLDMQRLSEIFGEYQTTLTIEEAMASGVISKARAFRIETNVDLSEVRFNGKSYNNADLEKAIRVTSRNELIADVIERYFNTEVYRNMQGVIFCTSVAHAKEMAKIMNTRNIPTLAAYATQKDPIQLYKDKKIRFLTSCAVISEGWDYPETSIVVMARPTLSKALYLQQVGRGFRKAPGKECLYVIDVVDQYGSLAIPWSINAIFGNGTYVPFGHPGHIYKEGEMIVINGIQEKVQRIQEINVKTFEREHGDLLSAEQAARELYTGTNTLVNWVRNGTASADLVIPFGSSKLYFFSNETIEVIRKNKNLGIHNESTIFNDFFEFIKDKQFTFSFKIIFMLSLIKHVDINGEATLDKVRETYVRFYLDRIAKGLKIDRDECIYSEAYLNDERVIKNSILTNPFEKFERKRFIYYSKDLSRISFNQILWSQLKEDQLNEIEKIMFNHLDDYYKDMDGVQEIDYLRRKP